MFKHPPQQELQEKALVYMLRFWTQQAMEEPEKCPPVRKRMVGAGAPGKLWRSTRGRDQKLSGDYWCMCISLELCCFTPRNSAIACIILNNSGTAGFGLEISPSPTCLWKGSPASCCPCPCTHQPGSLSHATAPSPSKWLQRAELTAKQPSWKGLSTQNYTWNLLDPYPEATVDIKTKSKLNIAAV